MNFSIKKNNWVLGLTICLLVVSEAARADSACYPAQNFSSSDIVSKKGVILGNMAIANDQDKISLSASAGDLWYFSGYRIYVGAESVPLNDEGDVQSKLFPYQGNMDPAKSLSLNFMFSDIGVVCGGSLNIAVEVSMVQLNKQGKAMKHKSAWLHGSNKLDGHKWGWSQPYTVECAAGPNDACTRSVDYFKDSNDWSDFEGLVLCGRTAREILQSTGEDSMNRLLQEYIAAALNILLRGTTYNDDVVTALTTVEPAVSACTYDASEESAMQQATAILSQYNLGFIANGGCAVE
jgi:hypothetical protein